MKNLFIELPQDGKEGLKIEKESDESIARQEEKNFINSFDLSPVQRGELKSFIQELKKPNTVPIHIKRLPKSLPQEALKTDFMRKLAKQIFYNCITMKDGLGSGVEWSEYMNLFGIEADFFKQPAFDTYKKRKWLERISRGYRFNDPQQFKKDFFGNPDQNALEEEKRKQDEELQYGTLESIELDPTLPEVKLRAAEGVLDKIFTSDPLKNENDTEVIIEEYKNLFKLTEEDIERALVLRFQKKDMYNFEKNDLLRKKYPFIESFLSSPQVKEMARQQAVDSFISLNEKFATRLTEYFSITEKEFNKNELLEKQKLHAIDSLKQTLRDNYKTGKNPQHAFFRLYDVAPYLSLEDWQQIFTDETLSSELFQAFTAAPDPDNSPSINSNISFLRSIGVQDEVIRKVGVAIIEKRFTSRDSFEVLKRIEVFSKQLGLSSSELKEGLTLRLLNLIDKDSGDEEYNIKDIKEGSGLTEVATSSEIEEKTKERFIKEISTAHVSKLKLMKEFFEIKWSPEEMQSRRDAVKHALMHRLDSFGSVKRLNDFLNTYYPDTHKIFLLADPELKENIENKLFSFLMGELKGSRPNWIKEMANYFNIPLERFSERVRMEIENGQFMSQDDQSREKFFQEYLNVDIHLENQICISNHGEEMLEKALETKNWEMVEKIRKYEPETPLVQKAIEQQMQYLGNMEKSLEHRKYAVEMFLYLDPGMVKYRPTVQSLFGVENLKPQFESVCDYGAEDLKEFIEIMATDYQGISSFENAGYTQTLIAYIHNAEHADRIDHLGLTKEQRLKLVELFNGPYRDISLDALKEEWNSFLTDKEIKSLPPKLFLISRAIANTGGAGNLKHVEALGNMMIQVNAVIHNPTTADRTKNEVQELLSSQEERIKKGKWSQDDQSEFYNLSRDILEAAPSLYAVFYSILKNMSPKDMKVFVKEVFPLYQAQLVTLQEMSGEEIKYKSKDLVSVRQGLKDLAGKIHEKQSSEEVKGVLGEEKTRLSEVMKNGFKNRFGLLKVPQEFTKENLRSIQNVIRYIGNINQRDATREAVIALYLGLELSLEWDAFRQGKEVKIEDYFSGKQLELVKPLIEEKKKSYELLGEIANISPEDMPRFQEVLQEDVVSNIVGNIETIDVKLANIKRNALELADPDIYAEQTDKKMMLVLLEEGKLVGPVLAKTYTEISGKPITMNEEEKALQGKIAQIFGIDGWTVEQVKHIQEAIQPLALVSNMINKMNEEMVDENIEELQTKLIPPQKVIDVFNRLGEAFKQESGAMALSGDITYLESLLVKDDKKLTQEEKEEVDKYLTSIKDKMKELEKILDKVREYFEKIKKSAHVEKHKLLKDRLVEIDKVIYSTNQNGMIISRMTKDLNLIIENMRQCLGCMRKEANNDTNLAFGDYNKFFIMNQSEHDKGSISDEIVFFVPVEMPSESGQTFSGEKEMSFVLDRVYGSKSSDVLISNIVSIYKKYQALKKEFPKAQLSISVTNEAMSSVGVNAEILKKRLEEVIGKLEYTEAKEGLKADILKSSFSDNYIEFGDKTARESGERVFSGFVIR